MKDWHGLEFHIGKEDMLWLKESFAARTKENEGAFSVLQQLNLEGWVSIVATP